MSEKLLALMHWRESGIWEPHILHPDELERCAKDWAKGGEIVAVPFSDVLALAGVHEDSGPARMLQPMTVDQVALRIMAAMYVHEDASTAEECARCAYNGAEAFMAEAMRRDAMGELLEQKKDDTDD